MVWLQGRLLGRSGRRRNAGAVRYTATVWMTFKNRWPLGRWYGVWFWLAVSVGVRTLRQRLLSLSEVKRACRSAGKTPPWARTERSRQQRSTAPSMVWRRSLQPRSAVSRRLTAASRRWRYAIERIRAGRGNFYSQRALVLDIYALIAIKLAAIRAALTCHSRHPPRTGT